MGFFNNKTGKPIGWVKTSFNTTCRKACIEGLRFHDLRHTFATRLALNGVDIVTVKELLGHSEIQTTMRYSHPTPLSKTLAVGYPGRESSFQRWTLYGHPREKRGNHGGEHK